MRGLTKFSQPILSLFFSLVPASVFYLVLDAKGPLLGVVSYCAVITILMFFGNRKCDSLTGLYRYVLSAVLFAGFAVLMIQILIIPYSAYIIWFQLVEQGQPKGAVSFLFVSFVGYFSCFLSLFFYKKIAPALVLNILFLTLTVYLIYRYRVLLTLLPCGLFLFLTVRAWKEYRQTTSLKNALIALILIFGSTLLISLPLSKGVKPQGNRLVSKTIAPNLRKSIVDVIPSFPLLYGIPGYGYTISEKRLGDPPLLSEQPVFRITATPGETLYLRCAIFDRFDGASWFADTETGEAQRKEAGKRPETIERLETNSMSQTAESVEMDGTSQTAESSGATAAQSQTAVSEEMPGATGTSKEAENVEVPGNADGKVQPQKSVPNTPLLTGDKSLLSPSLEQINVEVLTDYYSNIPHTLDTAVIYSDRDLTLAKESSPQNGFLLEKPLLENDNLILGITGRGYLQRNSTTVRAEESVSSQHWNYLQLPENIPNPVTALAEELSSDSVMQTVSAIGRFLEDEYRYSLTPSAETRDSDFLETFLFEQKEGFCVHFATAFIILARMNSIPTRYATGFYVPLPPAEPEPGGGVYADYYQLPYGYGTGDAGMIDPATGQPAPITKHVTGFHAHAWPEVFIPEYGWIPYEVTPPMRPDNYDSPGFWERYFSELGRYTRRQIEIITGREAASPSDPGETAGELPLRTVIPILSAAVLSIAVLLTGAIIVGKRGPAKAMSKQMAVLLKIAKRFVKKTEKHGIPPPDVIGWSEWEKRVYARLLFRGANRQSGIHNEYEVTEDGLHLFRDCIFGNHFPTEEELDSIKAVYKRARFTT